MLLHSQVVFHYLPPPPVAPNVTAISPNQTVTSPAPISFNCTVDSYPPSNITWLRNGIKSVIKVLIHIGKATIKVIERGITTLESILTLLNTTAEDIGTYTCVAENSEGSSSMTTELQVLGEYRQC